MADIVSRPAKNEVILLGYRVGLSDTTVLAIYRDILLLTIMMPCLYITVIKKPFVMQYQAQESL